MSACKIFTSDIEGDWLDAGERNLIGQRYWEVGEYAKLYQLLQTFMDCVLNTGELAFGVDATGNGRATDTRNVLVNSRDLAQAMGQCREYMDLYEPNWWYTSDLQLFFDCFREHLFGQVEPGMAAHQPFNEYALVAEVYNDFIDYLRKEAITRRVRKRLADWKAGLVYQNKTIRAYLTELYERYRWLLPVRVDHYFRLDAVDEADLLPRRRWQPGPICGWTRVASNAPSSLGGKGETRARIDPGLAMAYRNRFFENQHGTDHWLFEHMVGYVLKMEVGGKRGANHFHGLYLFDAKKAGDVDLLINGLMNRWATVTNGSGESYNCHASPRRADMIAKGKWALDVLDCRNPTHRKRLDDYVLSYFVKTDFTKNDAQSVRIKPTARANTLTTGQ
ncbi:inovirus-type Gp2 protein [Burkholderia cenocepacia]|uniref:inovirus-type Gp2 protein n=1 Tax=Burkholderia cenocepacia TaxID=95486 RepID=UPI002AB71077|nr:inovirus-type Gp2 protein [Burkholderia cenocepacia]